jgi:hypothetical protein
LSRASFGIGVAYVIVFVVGFASMGDLSQPLKDPYLPIAEILIVVLAPILVLLMVLLFDPPISRHLNFEAVLEPD